MVSLHNGIIETQVETDLFTNNALQTKPKASNDVVPFVVTYNPALPRISNILSKHFNILHSSNRWDVFSNHLLLLTDVALIFVTF